MRKGGFCINANGIQTTCAAGNRDRQAALRARKRGATSVFVMVLVRALRANDELVRLGVEDAKDVKTKGHLACVS